LWGQNSKDNKKKAKKYGMPVIYMDRMPTISKKALEEWWEDLKNKRNKHYKIVLLLLY
jgi:NAD+--asparagine ADP-ribosyltransferase